MQDGRRRRREDNRAAVVDALLELIRAGDLAPSADAVAARAGLSARSLFRYFDDLEDLCRTGIARQLAAVAPELEREVEEAPVDARIAAAVAQRVRLFEAMGAVGTFARLRAPFQPLVARQLAGARRVLRERLRAILAPALAPRDDVDAIVAAADVLCSFESYRLLRDDHGRSVPDAESVMTGAVLALAGCHARVPA